MAGITLIGLWFLVVIVYAEWSRRRAEPMPRIRVMTEFEAQMLRLQSEILRVQIVIGQALTPALKKAAVAIRGLADAFMVPDV